MRGPFHRILQAAVVQLTRTSTQHRFVFAQAASMSGIKYPTPRRSDVKDVLHGLTFEDPYRWLEDPESDETKAFIEAQNSISGPFLKQCTQKEEMKRAITEFWNFPKFSAPFKAGSNYYFMHNTGLQNQYVIYQQKDLKSEPQVFLDPNSLCADGSVSLTQTNFSKDGKYFVYALSQSGSDWGSIHIRDVDSNEDLPEKLERFRYSSISCTHDNRGFFYGQYDDWQAGTTGVETQAVSNQKIYYHRLNTSQEEDIKCFEMPENPKLLLFPQVSNCGKYLIVSGLETIPNSNVYVADISEGVTKNLSFVTVDSSLENMLAYVTNVGSTFYFVTDKGGKPNRCVSKVDINNLESWTEVLQEHQTNALQWVHCVNNDKLIVGYSEDVVSKVEIFDLSGKKLQTLPFEVGTVSTSPIFTEYEVFFHFVSFLTPGKIYRCEVDKAPTAVLEEYKTIELKGFATDDLETKQVFYDSKDGTRIPMFIIRKKDQPQDGSSNCLIYVYGGFSIPLSPSFKVFHLLLIKRLGFTVAYPNVRGGGEYGNKWHDGGRLKNKQNTFDDVQAAAEYLANEKYTQPSRLVLTGASNGGLVTTATINQRPELFGAAVAQVPVTDLFRFHKFTVGHAWTADFGNPDKADHFEFIKTFSPLHNIPTGIDNFPSLLVTTADHDDRAVPAHALKYIAEVQHRLGATNKKPLLAFIDTKAGHGGGKPTSKIIDELTEIMCFLQSSLNATYQE